MGIEDGLPISADENSTPTLGIELKKQLWLALPMIGVNLVQGARQLLSVMFVGHLGELELASASIATSFCVVTGNSFLVGLASALETLCGQAYGAKQYHLLGIYLQTALVILCLLSLPVAILWYNMEQVLLFFGQDPDIAHKGGIYARWMIPGLFAIACLQPLIKFLQTQSKVLPMFICSAATLIAHGILCWFFINRLGMGNQGAALTVSISFWLNVLLLILVVASTPSARECWHGFSSEAFKGFGQFLKLAIPSAVMICFEWWSFEALVMLSGTLPNPQLEASVFSIISNTNSVYFMIPLGIGAAVSTRISNELGAGRPAAARFALKTSLLLVLINVVIVSCTMLALREVIGRFYSNEMEVINYIARVIPFLVGITTMDAVQASVSGVARGCGWQATAAFVNLGAYYVIGLPVGYLLAFQLGMRGSGLMVGILCGVSVQAASLSIIALRTNWTKQAIEAVNRTSSSSAATTPLME